MRRHKPHSEQAVNPADPAEQFGKADRLLQVFAIGIDILAKKHDFNNTVGHCIFDFPYNIFRLTAPLPSPHIWHDTIAAEIITAEHNIDTCFKRIFPVIRQIFNDLLRILPYIDDHLFFCNPAINKFGKFENIMGPEDQIHMSITFFQFFHHFRFLHHTAAESNKHGRVFLFYLFHLTEAPINTQIGIFSYRTCIVDHKIRIFRINHLIAYFFKNACKLFRISCIHLTAKSNDRSRQWPSEFLLLLFHPLAALFHIIILTFSFRKMFCQHSSPCIYGRIWPLP